MPLHCNAVWSCEQSIEAYMYYTQYLRNVRIVNVHNMIGGEGSLASRGVQEDEAPKLLVKTE
jgi:hypothetical protein